MARERSRGAAEEAKEPTALAEIKYEVRGCLGWVGVGVGEGLSEMAREAWGLYKVVGGDQVRGEGKGIFQAARG